MSNALSVPVAFACVVFFLYPEAGIGGLTTSVAVDTGVVYSDNFERTPDNPIAQTVSRFQPSLTVDLETNKSNLQGVASAELLYFSESGQSRIDPLLFANSQTSILERRLFVDSSIQYRQINVEPQGTGAGSLNTVDGVADSVNFQLSPYFLHSFGSFADLNIRYTYNRLEVPDRREVGSVANSLQLALNHSAANSPIYWAVGSLYRTLDQSEGNQLTETNIAAESGYSLNDDWLVLFLVGREKISIDSVEILSEPTDNPDAEELVRTSVSSSDTIWEAGVVWKPNSRISVEARYGERGFGKKPSLKAELNGRRSSISLTWTKDYTTSRQNLSYEDPLVASSSAEVANGAVLPVDTSLGAFESIGVDETIKVLYQIRGRRTNVSFETLNSRRETTDTNFTDETTEFSSSLDRQINQKISASLQLSHARGSSGETVMKFRENRVALNVNYSF